MKWMLYFLLIGIVATSNVNAMEAQLDKTLILVQEYQAEQGTLQLSQFIDTSLIFFNKRSCAAPSRSKKTQLSAGSQAECIDAIVRKCMSVALTARYNELKEESSEPIELDLLGKNGKKLHDAPMNLVEPFTNETYVHVSHAIQKKMAEFLIAAVKNMHSKNFLVTERLYLWSIDSNALRDWEAAVCTEYAVTHCAPLLSQLALTKSCCLCHACSIL